MEQDVTNSPRRRIALLTLLSLLQDVGYAFLLLSLTVVLRQQGVPLEQLALLNLLALVWVAKFLWAPLVDARGWRRLGHYRGWVYLTQAVIVGALLALAPLDPVGDLPLVLAVTVVILLASGTQEIAISGLAVRLLRPDERGVASGLQLAATNVGIAIGSGGVVALYDRFGWTAAVCSLAAGFLVPLSALSRLREPAGRPAPSRAAAPSSLRSIPSFLRRPGSATWTLLLIPAYLGGIYLAQALVPPLLTDTGWSLTRIGLVHGTLSAAASVLAGVVSGALVRQLGRRVALTAFGLCQAPVVLGLLPLAAGRGPAAFSAATVVTVSALATAAATAAHTVAMDISRPDAGATDMTLQLTMFGVVRVVTGTGGLALAGAAGYLPLIAGGAALPLAAALLAAHWLRHRHEALSVPTPAASGPGRITNVATTGNGVT